MSLSTPLLSLHVDDKFTISSISAVFGESWIVVAGTAGTAASVDLILVDADSAGVVATIRSGGDASSRAAIVGLGFDDPALDDTIALPVRRDALRMLARRWSPLPTPALDRMADRFGRAPVVQLARGLNEQMGAALPFLAGEGDVPGAHQLAGLAGMLGFVTLGHQWAALDHGEAVDRRALHVGTRRAIVALDRFVAVTRPGD